MLPSATKSPPYTKIGKTVAVNCVQVIARALGTSDVVMFCTLAAVDTRLTGRHVNAYDGEERKKEDYDNLVNTALRKAGSKKALLPSKSKNQFKEVDLRDLTLSKRKFVVEQALEVKSLQLQACVRIWTYCTGIPTWDAYCIQVESLKTIHRARSLVAGKPSKLAGACHIVMLDRICSVSCFP